MPEALAAIPLIGGLGDLAGGLGAGLGGLLGGGAAAAGTAAAAGAPLDLLAFGGADAAAAATAAGIGGGAALDAGAIGGVGGDLFASGGLAGETAAAGGLAGAGSDILSANAASPLDTAAYPAGPVGAPGVSAGAPVGTTAAPAATGGGAAAVAPPAGVTAPVDLTSAAPAAAAGAAPAGGAAPAAAPSFLDKLISGATGALTKNPVGTALAAGGLGYNILQGQKNSAAVDALNSQAATQAAQGQTLQSYLANGTLPPALQAQLSQATAAAKARIMANYANTPGGADPTKNSALAQDLNNLELQAIATASQTEQQLLSSGIQESGLASNTLTTLANIQQAQSTAIGKSIANFAAALNGGNVGTGVTLKLTA